MMNSLFKKIILFVFLYGCFSILTASTLEETFKKQINGDDIKFVSVNNQNGNIEVSGWSGNQIEITAYKKVRTDNRERAEQLMEHLEIDINISGNELRIETIHPRRQKNHDSGFLSWLFSLGDNGGASVDYVIKVPQKMDLDLNSTNGEVNVSKCEGIIDLHTTNGKIMADKIKGSVNCKTTNGSIHAYLDKVYQKEDMTFKSTNGSIKVYIPGDTNADVEAETTNGSISCDLPIRGKIRQSKRYFYGEINNGGSLIYLKTTNGSIRIYEI
jgi:hypothetical protein